MSADVEWDAFKDLTLAIVVTAEDLNEIIKALGTSSMRLASAEPHRAKRISDLSRKLTLYENEAMRVWADRNRERTP